MADAYSKHKIKSSMSWSNALDTDGAFPIDVRAWFGSLAEAQAAAATATDFGSTDSKYHYGQQLYVFDGTKATTYLIQGDKSLKEIGSDAVYAFKTVSEISELYKLSNISPGHMIYVESEDNICTFKGGDPSDKNNWILPSSSLIWQSF